MKQAMVLSGGGAFAAFEVGVLKALVNGKSPATRNVPVEPSIYTGTSAGAFNAAVLVAKPEGDAVARVAHLEKIWLERIAGGPYTNGVFRYRVDPRSFFDRECLARDPGLPFRNLAEDTAFLSADVLRRTLNFLSGNEPLERRAVEMLDASSFISTAAFGRLVREIISWEAIRTSPLDLRVAATNWRTGGLRVFKGSEMTSELGPEAILASSAIPGVFPMVHIDGVPYVDGGVVMNTPLTPAVKAGADEVHLVALNPNVKDGGLKAAVNTLDTFERLLDIMVAGHVDNDVDAAARINRHLDSMRHTDGSRFRPLTIHRYHPRADLGGLFGVLNFGVGRIKAMIAEGERQVMEHDCERCGCVIASPLASPATTAS